MQQSRKTLIAVAALLATMAVLAGGAARRESVTVDEVAHIGAGVSYLQKLDLRMNEEHPPLAKVLAAVPLVLQRVNADYSHISWTFSSKMFNEFLGRMGVRPLAHHALNDPYSTSLWARVPMLLLTLLFGLAMFLARVWEASPRSLLCLCVFVSMPAFLAFGRS
jgi:hypothetical protein